METGNYYSIFLGKVKLGEKPGRIREEEVNIFTDRDTL